jgi:hypothetical protein
MDLSRDIAGGSLTLFDGVNETRVAAITQGSLTLAEAVAQRAGRFMLIWHHGATRMEMPISGSVSADGMRFDNEGESFALPGVTNDEPGTSRALLHSALAGEAEVAVERNVGRAVLRNALAVLCVVLGIYDAAKLYHVAVTIAPRVAFLSTEVSTINAPTSGTLAFIAAKGTINSGEPVIGIENSRGKTILVDAAEDAMVISADHAIGERIKRGDPLLAIAAPNPPVYISAIVSREQAFALTHGVVAHYALLDGGAPRMIELPLKAGDVSLNEMAGGNGAAPLYQARFRIEADNILTRGAPVYLEFERPLSDALEANLTGAGISPSIGATLLRPVAWLEALLLPGALK